MIRRANKERVSWMVGFYLFRPLAFLPQPRGIAVSTARNENYQNPGTARSMDTDGVVFQYTLAGGGRLRVGDDIHEVGEGRGLLCHVGDPDINYFYPADGLYPWRFLFFFFKEPGGRVKRINQEFGHVFELSSDSSLIRHLLEFGGSKRQTVEMTVGEGAMMVDRLLATLVDLGRGGQVDSNRNLRLVRDAHRLIDQNIFSAYNAGMLAEDLSVSQEHLNRVFRQEASVTPYQLITQLKMRHACMLLKETSLSCKEIALRLGYQPGSHFARSFKRSIGQSPRHFRRHGVIPL